jgi:small subunit ribosomal protein S3Ae
MTFGKNKGLSKKGGKGQKKNERHAFSKKEWFKLISAPAFGNPKPIGWIPCNTTIGKRRAEENVIGRICEVVQADINVEKNSQFHWRKVKMEVEKVEGGCLYTSFNGMSITREKIMSSLKKRQSLIDLCADVKTQDGFIVRIFAILCTKPVKGQKKVNSYAKSSEVKKIRKNLTKTLLDTAAKSEINKFADLILSDHLTTTLERQANKIYPIRLCLLTKVKVLKKSKIDVGKLVEESQFKVDAPATANDTQAAQNTLSKEVEELKASK